MIVFSSDHHHHLFKRFAKHIKNGRTNRLYQGVYAEEILHSRMKKLGAKAHIRCGDLFHVKDEPPAIVVQEVMQCIKRNVDAGIEEFITLGNHDVAAGGLADTISIFRDVGASIITKPCVQSIAGIDIQFIPYMYNATKEHLHDTVLGLPSGPPVVVGHMAVNGARTGTEFFLKGSVDSEVFLNKGYSRVILGHIHKAQTVFDNKSTRIEYVGPLTEREFGDEGAGCRALVLNTKDLTDQIELELPQYPSFRTVIIRDYNDLEEVNRIPEKKYIYIKLKLRTPEIKPKDLLDTLEPFLGGTVTASADPIDKSRMVLPADQNRLPLEWKYIFENYVDFISPLDIDTSKLVLKLVEYVEYKS